MSEPHPVYPGGPLCQPNCPGPHSMYHVAWALNGFPGLTP